MEPRPRWRELLMLRMCSGSWGQTDDTRTLVSQRQSELLEGYKTDVLTSINALEQTTHSAMSPLKEKGRRRKLEALQTELGLVHNSQAALEQCVFSLL